MDVTGVVIHSRSAIKYGFPTELKNNKENITLEASLELNGYGKHYVNVFTSPGVYIDQLLSTSDSEGHLDGTFKDEISKVNDCEYVFEINPTSNCFYQFSLFFMLTKTYVF